MGAQPDHCRMTHLTHCGSLHRVVEGKDTTHVGSLYGQVSHVADSHKTVNLQAEQSVT